MFTASFGPEIVEQKAPEDVERLSPIGEAARLIAVEVRGVVFLFQHGFTKKNERLGDVGAVGRLPFAPYVKEGIPGLLSRDAFHEVVLGRLRESLVAAFAGSLDSHGLEPGTHRQPVVEDQPGERPHLARAGIVPHSGNDLDDRRVVKVQLLDEGDDAGSVLLPPDILVSPLSRVSKERGVACRNPTLAKCRGESQDSQSWGLGVLRDSRMFRVRQQGPKHLALNCSWCHWKGLEA